MYAIKTTALVKQYKDLIAVDALTLEIPRGELFLQNGQALHLPRKMQLVRRMRVHFGLRRSRNRQGGWRGCQRRVLRPWL